MKPFTVAFCVLPEFALTSLAVGLDALRVANRMAGRPAFRWSVLSPDGGRIRASCGLTIDVDGRFPIGPAAMRILDDVDMTLVVAGFDPQKYCDPALMRWLAALRRRRRLVGGIASGAYVLAAAGLLDGVACTIHWENRTMLAERFPHVDIRPQIYVVDRGIYTCGGSSSVFDMMLHVIAEHAGTPVAAYVAEQSLLSTIRPPEVAVRR
ncbi:MAG: AraC family transcriptional regulator, partial [Alphaproteobacteria bacterium]|nr:AraC family transcriptional regulator [Alphaproteobacteria bacterium]